MTIPVNTAADSFSVQFDDKEPPSKPSLADAWQTSHQELEMQLPKTTFDLWLRDTMLLEAAGDVLTIGVRNAYAKEWLENRLQGTVSRTLDAVAERPVTLRFVVRQDERVEEAPPIIEEALLEPSPTALPPQIVESNKSYTNRAKLKRVPFGLPDKPEDVAQYWNDLKLHLSGFGLRSQGMNLKRLNKVTLVMVEGKLRFSTAVGNKRADSRNWTRLLEYYPDLPATLCQVTGAEPGNFEVMETKVGRKPVVPETATDVDLEKVDAPSEFSDGTPTHTYVQAPHYWIRFWRPLLGVDATALFELLTSFYYYIDKSSRSNVNPSIQLLMDSLGYKDRRTLTGRHSEDPAKRKQGLFDVLHEARLLDYEMGKNGREQVVIIKYLAIDLNKAYQSRPVPVLTPAQVLELPASLQQEHERFLRCYKKFDYEMWASDDRPTRLPPFEEDIFYPKDPQ